MQSWYKLTCKSLVYRQSDHFPEVDKGEVKNQNHGILYVIMKSNSFRWTDPLRIILKKYDEPEMAYNNLITRQLTINTIFHK